MNLIKKVNWRFWLGIVISLTFITLLLYRVQLQEVLSTMRQANYLLVIPAICVYFVATYFRALRWRYIIWPIEQVAVSKLFIVVVIGYTANNLLPARLGEIIRAYYLARKSTVRDSTALATIAVERIYDGITCVLIAAVCIPILVYTGVFKSNVFTFDLSWVVSGISISVVFLIALTCLLILLIDVVLDGYSYLSWDFLTNYASRKAENSGILAPLAGTLWLVILTAFCTIPLGVSTALYLEEFAGTNILSKIIKINISNLAGVPSIIYGLLGLAFFTYFIGLGKSIIAGALTMTLLVLPIVIISAQEAIRTVQPSLKEAAYALGATKWEVSKKIILPHSIGGIMSGIILAMSRAVGETAPILIISSLVFITTVPSSPLDRFTVLPLQIYTWASFPKDEFRAIASAGIIVLLIILITMNSLAIYIRWKNQTDNY